MEKGDTAADDADESLLEDDDVCAMMMTHSRLEYFNR
jgi:hypothetical protein